MAPRSEARRRGAMPAVEGLRPFAKDARVVPQRRAENMAGAATGRWKCRRSVSRQV